MQSSRVVAFLILFIGFQCVQASGQQKVATWTDATGNWSNPANWSTLTVPNNGGGTTYSVTIGTSNSVVTMDVLNATIDNLNLDATNILNIGSRNNLSLASGASTNYGSILIFNLGGTLTINSGASLSNFGGIGLVTLGSSLMNDGTLINNSGAVIHSTPDSSITNNGAGATFVNSGTVFLDLGGSLNNFSGTFNNSGVINAFDGVGFIGVGNSGTFNNSGTISIESGCTEVCNVGNSGTFNNSGTFSFTGCGIISSECSFGNSGTFNNSGTLNVSVCPQTASFCDFSNSGTFNNSGKFNLACASGNPDCSFTNSGTINNTSGAKFTDSGTINNGGNFTNSGAVTITSSGLFTTSTNYMQTAGKTLVDGTLATTGGAIVNIQGGTLGGTGTINGNVLMAGTMMPGDAPGTLTIFGNYEQAGTGIFKELMSPYAQAFLDVSGNVVLDPGAKLDITLLGGFNPLGDTISIMDFSTLSGQFANGSSFLDDGFLWDVTYRQHEIDVTAVQAVPEPSPMLLLSVGFIALGAIVKRKEWQNS